MPIRPNATRARYQFATCAALAAFTMIACSRPSSAPGDAGALRNAAGDSVGKVPQPGVNLTSTWGGDHIELVVSDTGATVQYDCAHGVMSSSPKPDASGRFEVSGQHVFEHGGPVRLGEPEDSREAVYAGLITGSTMSLTVRVTGVSAPLGPFSLRRGERGRLTRCY